MVQVIVLKGLTMLDLSYMVLDMTDSECASLVNTLVEHFSNTALGKFGVNVQYGKSYGDMRSWKR